MACLCHDVQINYSYIKLKTKRRANLPTSQIITVGLVMCYGRHWVSFALLHAGTRSVSATARALMKEILDEQRKSMLVKRLPH